MDLKDKIESLDIKTVALRKAADENAQKLEDLKKQITNQPASALRHQAKKARVINFEKDFINGKWDRKNKKNVPVQTMPWIN